MLFLELREDEDRFVPDGVYDITGIDFIEFNTEDNETFWTSFCEKVKEVEVPQYIEDFINKHPNFAIASAYETFTVILLARMPEIKLHSIGSGFNYGSTNIIENCPRAILILAEND